ncbi:MAG: sulfur carrier protein ThiS [Candidatus Omnitrophota bacterium]
MITVHINGEKRKFKKTTTIDEILKSLKIDKRLVVVEVNYKVIKKEMLHKVFIKDKDSIEIVQFVGGGV